MEDMAGKGFGSYIIAQRGITAEQNETVGMLELISLILLASLTHVTGRGDKVALIVIDVQTCFTSGGTLEVTDGDEVVDVINAIRDKYEDYFDTVVLSQDWHCPNHVSFASQHTGTNLYDVVQLDYNAMGQLCRTSTVNNSYAVPCAQTKYRVSQTMWPDHCVIGTDDAKLHQRMRKLDTDIVVKKGYHCQVDSYSAFFDNGGFQQTELQQVLEKRGITAVFVTGLARDFCVYWTSTDARLKFNYKTYMVLDATRPVAQTSGVAAVADMKRKGIIVTDSDSIGSDLLDLLACGGATCRVHTVTMVLSMLCVLLADKHL